MDMYFIKRPSQTPTRQNKQRNEFAVASLSNMNADGFTHGDEEKRAKKNGVFQAAESVGSTPCDVASLRHNS